LSIELIIEYIELSESPGVVIDKGIQGAAEAIECNVEIGEGKVVIDVGKVANELVGEQSPAIPSCEQAVLIPNKCRHPYSDRKELSRLRTLYSIRPSN
jgi:hypothetical protein